MNSRFKLVLTSLCIVFNILVCTFVLVVNKNYYYGPIGEIEMSGKSNSTKYDFNNSIFESLLHGFETDAVVELNELQIGTAIEAKEVQQKFRRVNRVCEKYNLTTTLERTHFLYSPEHRALYCWIRKVASTSFTKFFGDLRGRRVSRNYYRLINFLAPRSIDELKKVLNDTEVFKFFVIRHPFQRLVSSYRDRIEDNSRYTAQAWIYAPRIFHLTRPEIFHKNATTDSSSKHIFNSHKRLKLIPTFREFVIWLLEEPPKNDDPHWHAYHNQCSLCNAKFDYILDLDNYTANDVSYIFEKLNLDVNRNYLPKIQLSRGGKSDFPRTCEYFQNLSRNIVEQLYERYKIDFEMFDYPLEDYVNCARSLEP